MKLIYSILISALTSCTTYSMDIATQESHKKSTKESIPRPLVKKNPAPKLTHIRSFTTRITFNKKTKPLFELVKHTNNNRFCKTAVKTLHKERDSNTIYILDDVMTIKDLDEAYIEAIAHGNSFYYSNIERKYLNEQIHKFIRYGTLIVFFNRNYNKMEPQDLKESLEHDAAIFMTHHLNSQKKSSS